MLQEWVIFPGRQTQGRKYAIVNPHPDSELAELKTALGDRIYVLFGKARSPDGSIRSDSATRPTLIFFYGNAMCLRDAVDFCRWWRKLGANVLGVEYPGYGMSSGKPGEKSFYAAADAAYDYLLSRHDVDKTRIIPLGLSIGTGVAVELACRRPVAALALFAPFTSLDDLASDVLPWLPTSWILRHHFRNEQKIASLELPILIAHGRHDSIIPQQMSLKLVKAAKKNAQITTVFVDADHNDLFDLAGDELDRALAAFIEQVSHSPPAQRP